MKLAGMAIKADLLPKAASEVRSYLFDFSDFPEVRDDGETLSSPVTPAVTGLTIGTPAVTTEDRDEVAAGRGVEVTVSGGTAGVTYSLSAFATTSGGSVLCVKGRIAVE